MESGVVGVSPGLGFGYTGNMASERRSHKQRTAFRWPMARRNRRLITAVFVLGLAILVAVDRLGLLSRPRESDQARYHDKPFTVLKVVDGDTLDLDVEDCFNDKPSTRVRLWGVDTPETHTWRTSKDSTDTKGPSPMYFGPEASEFAKRLVGKKQVTVQLEPVEDSRGKYRRLLAYIYLPDGRMLNEELIQQGYGYADERFRHMHRRRFLDLQKEAQREQRGLWKDVKPEQMPPWYRKRRERR